MIIKILKDGSQVVVPGTNNTRTTYLREDKEKIEPVEIEEFEEEIVIEPIEPEEIEPVEIEEFEKEVEIEEIVIEPIEPEKDKFPSCIKLNSMLKSELKQLANDCSIDNSGNKPILKNRLVTYAESNGLFE